MKKKWIIGGIVVLLVMFAGGFFTWKSVSSKTKPSFAGMPTVKVERGAIEKVIYAKGVIAEVQRQEVNAEVRSKVTRLAVKVGDRVRAGDLLFALDEGDARLAVEQEEIAYQGKAGELARAADAVASDTVRAPVGGKLVKILAKEGDKVEPDTLVAEIADPEIMEISAAYGPVGIEKVSVGQKVKVFLDNWTTVYGNVVKVDKRGKPDVGGGIVHDITVRFKNPGLITGTVNSVVLTLADGTEVCSVETGTISDAESVKVKAGSSGTVLKILVKETENIAKNTIIAKLDVASGRTDLQDRRLALRQAGLAKEMKAKELEKYRVLATQEGVVTEVNVVQGQEPPADKPAVIISSAAGLELRAKVEEADIPFIHVGQQATVYVNAFEDRKFPGIITEIARQGKTDGGVVVFETKIRVKDPGPLRIGMNGDVDIVVERKEGCLRLPTGAVVIEGKKGTVMIPGAAGPKPKEVQLGLEGNEFIEIINGLKPGEQVLVNPQARQPMGF